MVINASNTHLSNCKKDPSLYDVERYELVGKDAVEDSLIR